MNPQQQRIIIMVLAGIFSVMVLIGVGVAIYQSQKGKVIITAITPADATAKLDGKEVKKGTHFIEPGKHQFVTTRVAFVEKKIDFEIKPGETRSFELYAMPDASAGLEWVIQNPDEASELDGYVSRAYDEATDRLFASNQILSALPIMDTGFRIDHGVSKTGRPFALYVQANDEAGRVAAIETLKYLGYNPEAFEIIYKTPE